MAGQQRLAGAAVETRSPGAGQRTRPRHHGQPPAARHQQVEQDRAPPLFLYQPELARQATRQLSRDRRADLGHHHQNRPHRALRTRHWPIPQRHCRLGRRDGRHQYQTRRIPRRVELHYLAECLSSRLRVYFLTIAKRPEHMGAWDYCQRGFWHVHKGTRADGMAAYGLFEQALMLDPILADAHLGLARALIVQWDYGSVEDFAPFVRQARESALQAAALDSENPQAQYVLAQTSHWAGDVGAAIAHASRAIELNANFALGHFYLGIGLSLDGRHQQALEAIETGLRLSPRDPRASTWLANKARVLYHLRCYEEAIETALSARRIQPHAYGTLVLVASYARSRSIDWGSPRN